MIRSDFAFPFAIDAASGQAARASYQDHVEQMIRQVLLTDPGERVCLPTFGAGLRRLLFAPVTAQLQASTQMAVTQALTMWLASQITVQDVSVETSASSLGLPDGRILITVTYVLIETPAANQVPMRSLNGRRARDRPQRRGLDGLQRRRLCRGRGPARAACAFPQRGRDRRSRHCGDDRRRRPRADGAAQADRQRRRLVDRFRRPPPSHPDGAQRRRLLVLSPHHHGAEARPRPQHDTSRTAAARLSPDASGAADRLPRQGSRVSPSAHRVQRRCAPVGQR